MRRNRASIEEERKKERIEFCLIRGCKSVRKTLEGSDHEEMSIVDRYFELAFNQIE
jgi:hypothetical protein